LIKLPPYVTTRRKKGGVRYYFQVPKHTRPASWSSKPIRLSDTPIEMMKQAGELYDRLKAERGGKPKLAYVEGSIPWLLQEYHKSPRYRNLAKTTQGLYDWCETFVMDWSKKAEHPHVKYLTRPALLKFLRQFDDTPTKKKKIATFVSVLLSEAIDRDIITINPAKDLNLKEPDSEVHIWTVEEVAKMVYKADEMGFREVATAILINYELGQRPTDIRHMQAPRDYSEGYFLFRQNKTGELLKIRASERLQARLAGREGLLVRTHSNTAYTRTGFGTVFNTVRDSANLRHCTFQQLRHTAVVGLARASCTVPEIASITGHTAASVAAILKRYLPRDAEVAENAVVKRETYSQALDSRKKSN
jgi:integrase